MRHGRILLLAAVAGFGCQAPEEVARIPDGVEQVAAWMEGSFSSGTQAAADQEHYLDVRLEMRRIWPWRTDGAWLYVEQAVATALDRPYRQRIYRLTESIDGSLRSDVYELPGDPLGWAGVFRSPGRLDSLAPEDLALRAGCAIHLRRTGRDEVRGATLGDGCLSSLRGARFATSNVRITPDLLESWDRGFDHEGQQVWGATQGPYVFLKR